MGEKKSHDQRNGGGLLAALRAHPEGVVMNSYTKKLLQQGLAAWMWIQIKHLFYFIQG